MATLKNLPPLLVPGTRLRLTISEDVIGTLLSPKGGFVAWGDRMQAWGASLAGSGAGVYPVTALLLQKSVAVLDAKIQTTTGSLPPSQLASRINQSLFWGAALQTMEIPPAETSQQTQQAQQAIADREKGNGIDKLAASLAKGATALVVIAAIAAGVYFWRRSR